MAEDGKLAERRRLAEALRANLKRRKAAASRPAREADDGSPDSSRRDLPEATLAAGPEGERG